MKPRFIVLGAGAIGGTVGARLAQAGDDVALVARGAHAEAIGREGLRLVTPSEDSVLRLPVVTDVRTMTPEEGDIVLLCVKSQHTEMALETLELRDVPIICLQNGVENERRALRRHGRVYGAVVVMPASHTIPGEVEAQSAPCTGVIDVGRWPHSVDAVTELVIEHLTAATFSSQARSDVMRWKYAKLVSNTGNAVEALCGVSSQGGTLGEIARQEAYACVGAAGIDVVPEPEFDNRIAGVLNVAEIAGRPRVGSSTTQSMLRGLPVETDDLTGEIVLLGRLHGFPTPVNALLQRRVWDLVRSGRPPGSVSEAEVLTELGV